MNAATQQPSDVVNMDAEPPHGDFYVTVRDEAHNRTGYLLGPYADLRDALANVNRGRSLAFKRTMDAPWYLYGTARVPIGTYIKPVFA